MSLPRVVITIGDPAGIGPEVVLKALTDPAMSGLAEWRIVGDDAPLRAAAGICGIDLQAPPVRLIDVGALPADAGISPGAMRAEYGAAAVAYVRTATEMCLRGEADAMATAPLNKEAVTLSGMKFTGHTEYIADLCGAKDPSMLLVSEKMAVAHVSTHVALTEACHLTTARVLQVIRLGADAVEAMRGRAPRVAVCGLNPHAGEHGLFGREDTDIILPAVEQAQTEGALCSGPHSADTVFLQAFRGAYDLVVAMYHDQGHIPMKLMAFDDTVNVSLGIPIIRTSVDHGTAFDIAGRNEADPRNMKSAMRLAAAMARSRLRANGRR